MSEGNIAIITARGGSKRIPRKNIKLFMVKPIIVYSIEAALKSGIFEEIMVSTDDEEIAEISKTHGASVPFLRSEKTSGDFATTSDVIAEVLTEYSLLGKTFLYACCIYPTAPFVTAEKLAESFRIFKSRDADSLFPVVRFSYPPQRAYVLDGEQLRFRYPENKELRSQDLEPLFHDAGQYYFFRPESFLKTGSIISGNLSYVELSEMEVQDIDNETDWKLAEMKYGVLLQRKQMKTIDIF